MEPTPYVQPTRNRRRCQWRRKFDKSPGYVDPHATPDIFWSSDMQCAPKGGLCKRLTAAEGCPANPRFNEMHRQSGMDHDFPMHMEDALTSPHNPCARHLSMEEAYKEHSLTRDPSVQPSRVRRTTDPEDKASARIHLQAPAATVFGTSPGNTPMPKRIRRTLGSVPEPPRKHGTPESIAFTPFQFVSGVRSAQTCPGKQSCRLQQAPAKHKVKAVRRTLDLREAPSTVLQSRKEAGWRMRRPLVARAGLGRAQCLPRRNLFQRDVRRTGVETPAPLFSLAEAEATLQPEEPQGHRGLPPLAKSLRKRSQEDEGQHANRKQRAVQAPIQDASPEQKSKSQSPGSVMTQPARSHHMGLSPSARMAALRLRD